MKKIIIALFVLFVFTSISASHAGFMLAQHNTGTEFTGKHYFIIDWPDNFEEADIRAVLNAYLKTKQIKVLASSLIVRTLKIYRIFVESDLSPDEVFTILQNIPGIEGIELNRPDMYHTDN